MTLPRDADRGPIPLLGAAIVALLLGLLLPVTSASDSADAAPSGSTFQDGYIISDQKFFDYRSMDPEQVQSFLNERVTRCVGANGQPCLRDFSTTATAIAGDSYCTGMPGGTMSAAQIIVAAARACGISPKVLIVMLQKEQGLVTATSPTARNYQAALGQSCPDTAPCDSAYSGFYRQVYYGARQMRMYIAQPSWYAYQLGWNNILYSPTTSCGTKRVYIQNNATRALYIYTPYTPNAAALSNLYGTGDGCSSYGNRNFWRTYWDWFGSPTDSSPIGSFDSAQPAADGIRVTGWALDFDSQDTTLVHVYVDGAFASGFGAATSRPDVEAAHKWGAARGFDTVVPASTTGSHRVCVYALNVGSGHNTELGCKSVTMFSGDPIGSLDAVQAQPGGLAISGWALDTDTAAPIWVHAYVDGAFSTAFYADGTRADVSAVHPGFGDKHGYSFTVKAATGQHRVCLYAINEGRGTKNTELGCMIASVGGDPLGEGLSATAGPQQLTVSGWAIDPDTTEPTWVHIYVDGAFAAGAYADQQRSDLGVYSAFGTKHGYSTTVPAGSGSHEVCSYGINVGGGANRKLGCVRAEVGASPVGKISNGQPDFASIGVWGWAYDPDVAGAVDIHIYMDGQFAWGGGATLASTDAAVPAPYGTKHGFAARFYAAPGSHRVCTYALNVGVGTNTELGCFTTTVSAAGDPRGALDSVTPGNGGVRMSGWALDGDTREPVWVHVYVDGAFAGALLANGSRGDVGAVYPGYTSTGFDGTVTAAAGSHHVCAYALNVGAGSSNTEIGCRTATVP
ncbi:hypothetical protein JNB63_05005 [Microbacterium trichothecenolyticum]|uniref:hypothetical protein n=1 Tax=Microbacterium trichothecenolyticum TaxID=69370 RepID=UPI001C6E3EE6|nr:hypothetical protein [Microbacterium trichothecenolyticum]MBW9119446.1 hypothetical protein [Microbacterium trichothecenolyticum]